MKIGIDASRAFLKQRTGIEEYAYKMLAHLREEIDCEHEVVLYVRQGQVQRMHDLRFVLPHHWSIREITMPRYWTQIGLSRELQKHPVDVLFIPAHTIPIVHPTHSIVTIHGLEYEFCPEAYSWWERLYMRWSIKHSCRWAKNIIAVSENTRNDLVHLYHVPAEKITVISEGFDEQALSVSATDPKQQSRDAVIQEWKPYIFYIGRIEERKNIIRMIAVFELLKRGYHVPHKLVLAGKPGYGYGKIARAIQQSEYKEDIIEMGYVSEHEKWTLLKNADIFLFTTLYEGFGLPVLEAQLMGVPSVISNISSLPEIAGGSAVLVDPHNVDDIVEAVHKIISDDTLKHDMIEKGKNNTKRFSWQKSARQVAEILIKKGGTSE